MDVKNKTVIVTGAGSGIGRALAVEFGRNGAFTVCCGRRAARLEETVGAIRNAGGDGCAVAADITKREDVRRLVGTVMAKRKSTDILFNNAGSFRSIAGVHETDPDIWWEDVTVNLLGSYLMIREILPHMMTRNEGVIITMDGGRPVGGSGYACGKAGAMELTRVLAQELTMQKSNVMAIAAGPGLVRTEMTQLQAETEAGRKWIPSTREYFDAGKERRPEEIATATLRMLAALKPSFHGKAYGPDTDFATW